MKVTLAKTCGFCFGVKNAVNTAKTMISPDSGVTNPVMLGEVVHNKCVVNELVEGGFRIIGEASEALPEDTVIIRAHGITPKEKKILEDKGCEIIDRTCPFVSKIHKIVSDASKAGKDIIIAGAKGHPEVVGICGEAEGSKVTVISSKEEFESLEGDLSNSILVAQTTFSLEEFKKICAVAENIIEINSIFATICSTTKSRQQEALDLATESDVMIVIGSKHSSNTNKLFDICRSRCARTFLVENIDGVEELLFNGSILQKDNVGITAGASTPESIFLEVVRKMNENEVTDINFVDYIDGMQNLKRGAIVKGVITSVDSDYVYVDVKDKSEGKILLKEFENDPDFNLDEAVANHSEIQVMVKSIRNTDMGKEIVLSKSQVDFDKNKKIVEEAYENKTPITVKITHVVKDGIIGNFGGIDIYIHRTQIDVGEAAALESYKGQSLDVIITKMETEKHRLRVSGSHRQILAAARREKAEELWNTIEVGNIYKGVVRNLPDFGAFVDIGGVDGLVHNSELSWSRIKRSSDVLSIGDEIEVYVKSVDKENKKISLGYKKEEDDPYYNIEERIPVGSIVRGKVVRITDFGAFVELEPNLDALCHVSEISTKRLKTPADVLTTGQEVEAKVIDIKKENRRISISIKAVNPIDPETSDDEEATEE